MNEIIQAALLDELPVRELTKPSTAKCTIDIYTAFLLAESKHSGCSRLASVFEQEVSHDSVNRFLRRETYAPKDLFEAVLPSIERKGGYSVAMTR